MRRCQTEFGRPRLLPGTDDTRRYLRLHYEADAVIREDGPGSDVVIAKVRG
jgi:hypothetical protein